MFRAIGFSTITCLPASRQGSTESACTPGGVATATTSTSGLAASSWRVIGFMPCLAAKGSDSRRLRPTAATGVQPSC